MWADCRRDSGPALSRWMLSRSILLLFLPRPALTSGLEVLFSLLLSLPVNASRTKQVMTLTLPASHPFLPTSPVSLSQTVSNHTFLQNLRRYRITHLSPSCFPSSRPTPTQAQSSPRAQERSSIWLVRTSCMQMRECGGQKGRWVRKWN